MPRAIRVISCVQMCNLGRIACVLPDVSRFGKSH